MNNLQVPDQQTKAIIKAFADHYDIPVTGITNMGGKPYVNSAGLMAKAKKLGLKSIKIVIEQPATRQNMSAVVRATVKLKDGSEFEDYGFGSKDSIKMSTLHNPDFITMTTITRAKSRALRSATGFGLVSAEEVSLGDSTLSADQTNLNALESPKALPEKKELEIDVEVNDQEPIEGVEEDVKVEENLKKEDLKEMDKVKEIDAETEKIRNEIMAKNAEDIFGTEERKKNIEELRALIEAKNYDVNKLLDRYMATKIEELSDSQLKVFKGLVEKGLIS